MKNKKYYGDSETASVSRKTILYLVLIVALATIATIIIVAITAAGGNVVDPPTDLPVDKPQEKPVEMLCPLNEYNIDKVFANDKLLYSTTLKLWETHEAIDLKAEKGTAVRSILDGTVIAVGYNSLDGGYITITHADGVVSTYKSLAKEITLVVGDTVKRGDTIGKVSDTMLAEIKQGAHLHLEIKVNNVKVNPMEVIPSLGTK